MVSTFVSTREGTVDAQSTEDATSNAKVFLEEWHRSTSCVVVNAQVPTVVDWVYPQADSSVQKGSLLGWAL